MKGLAKRKPKGGNSATRLKRAAKAAVPKKPKATRSKLLTPEAIEEIFRRFAAANPEPKSELEYRDPFTLLVAVVLSAQATDARRQQGDAAVVQDRRHAGKDGAAGRGQAARSHQDDRALPQQGAQRHRAVAPADCGARRNGAARPRRARGVAGRRPKDRQRGFERDLRRADHGRRHARVSCRAPNRAFCAGRHRFRSRRICSASSPRSTLRMRITG